MTEKKTFWLLKDGEQLPVIDGCKKMRTWRLAEELLKRGHQVIWWSSTFYHIGKIRVAFKDSTFQIAENFNLELLEAGSYKNNISLSRVLHHYRLGKKFAQAAAKMKKPDIILCAYPTIDFAVEAVNYGLSNNVPVVLDVRDMWPDTFREYFPYPLRPIVDFFAYFMNRRTKYAFKNSSSIVSMSPDVLEWALSKTKTKSVGDVFYLSSESLPKNTKETNKFDFLRKIKKDKIVISFIGTFGKTYDLITVCDVARQIEKTHDDILFVFAGTGTSYAKIEQLSSSLSNVKLVGWVDIDEYHDLMSLTDICIVPSQANAIPNKFTEALACGKPILCSCTGYIEKMIIEHNIGYSYQMNNANSLLNALEKITKNNHYKSLKKNVDNLFFLHFDPKKLYADYADYLEAVIEDYNNLNSLSRKTRHF